MSTMPIERGKIREYALATGNARSEYLEDDRAPIPPTFLATVVFWEDLLAVYETPEATCAWNDLKLERDVRNLLSLEQEYIFHGPVPRAGDVLETSVRFIGLEVKQARSGPLTLARFMVAFRDRTHELRAECLYTSAYLSVPAGRGPESTVKRESAPIAARVETPLGPHAVGARFAPRRFGPVTMTDIVRYQGASGDMNPMHHDDELARSAGYPAAFSVGMLGAGYLGTYCTEAFGVDTVRRFRTRFRKVVYRGETLTATAEVLREFDSHGEARAEVRMSLTDGSGAVVVDGTAEFATR